MAATTRLQAATARLLPNNDEATMVKVASCNGEAYTRRRLGYDGEVASCNGDATMVVHEGGYDNELMFVENELNVHTRTWPFRFDVQGYRGGLPALLYRPETWTKVSNIIFIDSPVGSGFSYGTLEEGFISSDTTAVKRLVVFLKKWLRGHPQFLSNSLYVGGESYCGMIIPTLALEIHISNKESGEEPLLNLKGYFAGNPVTDDRFDTAGKVQFFHGMGLLSDELYENAKKIYPQFAMENCGGNYSDPPNVLCAESIQAIADSDAQQLSYIWANDEGVRESLGVRKGTKGEWKRCDRDLPYARDITSTVEIHSRLRRQGYPALIYSGDHDSKFPFVGTQAWIRSLNLSITDDWRPWPSCWSSTNFRAKCLHLINIGRSYSTDLTYATVKGAGHTAPEYKPKECLEMFARWLSGDPL
uniref:Serine carboxypeptidase-like 18 n=1 Tax=Aegilops tauschii TaxID=37682 RepID=N1QY91_AEGTA